MIFLIKFRAIFRRYFVSIITLLSQKSSRHRRRHRCRCRCRCHRFYHHRHRYRRAVSSYIPRFLRALTARLHSQAYLTLSRLRTSFHFVCGRETRGGRKHATMNSREFHSPAHPPARSFVTLIIIPVIRTRIPLSTLFRQEG